MANAGHRLGVAGGSLGLVVAALLTTMLGVGDVWRGYPLGVSAGAATVVTIAGALGGALQRHISSGGVLRAAGLGAFIAVTAMEGGLIVGTSVEGAAFNHVALFSTNLVGLAPAVILGSWFGIRVSVADQ
jgi:hypothetical protein